MEQRKPLHRLLEAINELKPVNESQKVALDAVVCMITETDYYGDLKTLLQIEEESTVDINSNCDADEIMWQHISKERTDLEREGLIDAPIWKAHLNAMEEYASLARKQVIEELEEWVNQSLSDARHLGMYDKGIEQLELLSTKLSQLKITK